MYTVSYPATNSAFTIRVYDYSYEYGCVTSVRLLYRRGTWDPTNSMHYPHNYDNDDQSGAY